MTAPAGPYIAALEGGSLFTDLTYQREPALKRVAEMAAALDRRLLGVLEVVDRGEDAGLGRYAILDGGHRHAAVMAAADADDEISRALVCQVYEGLSRAEEARLFHEINARRKGLNFWDRWKARRASGEQLVVEIETALAKHGLKIDPKPADGNISATKALEVIVGEIGDVGLLEATVLVLRRAFGHNRDAFGGTLMQGLARALAAYPPAELDRDRLVDQLADLPVRQLRVRADGLREIHRGGQLPRLFAAVIVEQYNRGPGRPVQPFMERVRQGSRPARVRTAAQAPASSSTPTPGPPPPRPNQPADAVVPQLCSCRHGRALHESSGGRCLAGCRCVSFTKTAAYPSGGGARGGDVPIEQALARGMTVADAAAYLEVDVADVERVAESMDTLKNQGGGLR